MQTKWMSTKQFEFFVRCIVLSFNMFKVHNCKKLYFTMYMLSICICTHITIKYLQLEAAIASKAASSILDWFKCSVHISNNGCFSGKINSSCIDLHKSSNSFSVAQKKHWNMVNQLLKVMYYYNIICNLIDNLQMYFKFSISFTY